MNCIIEAKAKYCGGGRCRGAKRPQTPGQARAAIRKKRNQQLRAVADLAEATRRGITVSQLQFERAKECQELRKRSERERREKLSEISARSSRYGYGRY